jgi:hypothetical protein
MRFLVLCGLLCGSVSAKAPEAIEIGPLNVADLPGGREADGIIGDFVLRNDRIEVLVSGNLHNRKANMGTNWGAPTPGCIYDFTYRGVANDQLTCFAPGKQEGQLSSVRILSATPERVVVRAELTPAAGKGIGRIHDYILEPEWQHVVVLSTYQNTTRKKQTVEVSPSWKGLTNEKERDGIFVGECQDPADRIAYGYAPMPLSEAVRGATGKVELAPGETRQFAAALVIAHGTAEAYARLSELLGKPVRRIRGQVVDADGKPAPWASILLDGDQDALSQFVDADGRFDFPIPAETKQLIVRDLGRPDLTAPLPAGDEPLTLRVKNAAGLDVAITDAQGKPMPCKVQFIGIEGTKTPRLGPNVRARGGENVYQSENGRFTQQLPPGVYRVIVTRGPEYDHIERTVQIEPGKIAKFEGRLERVIDSTGWISSDFHNHSTPSGDNYCGTDDRLINLAAEGVEFAPATEHNRIYEWAPHIERLGLAPFLATCTGMELTGNGPHLNAFPLKPVPHRQNNGAPDWNPDPRIAALTLRQLPGDVARRWVHLNHPDVVRNFNDENGDGKSDGGYRGLPDFVNAVELFGDGILKGPSFQWNTSEKPKNAEAWPFAWLQMLNRGIRIWTLAVSDAHATVGSAVGGWRTYLRSSSDDPAQVDVDELIASAKAGKSFVSTGPFLEVSTPDGIGPGGTVVNEKRVRLRVRVQCNTWTDIDRVAVLVNGRIDPRLDLRRSERPELFLPETVRFQQELLVPLDRDAHLIVVAIGENNTLEKAFGDTPRGKLRPVAYHNPIFVDVDGNGFEPNGDTLDQPYLKLD